MRNVDGSRFTRPEAHYSHHRAALTDSAQAAPRRVPRRRPRQASRTSSAVGMRSALASREIVDRRGSRTARSSLLTSTGCMFAAWPSASCVSPASFRAARRFRAKTSFGSTRTMLVAQSQ